jgi:hypothetical protein
MITLRLPNDTASSDKAPGPRNTMAIPSTTALVLNKRLGSVLAEGVISSSQVRPTASDAITTAVTRVKNPRMRKTPTTSARRPNAAPAGRGSPRSEVCGNAWAKRVALGSGAYGFDPYVSLSYQAGRWSPHGRLGYQFNTSTVLAPTYNAAGDFTGNQTLPGGFQYDVGADVVLFKKVSTTFAGDYLGYYVVNSPVLTVKPFGSQPAGPPLVNAYDINPPGSYTWNELV